MGNAVTICSFWELLNAIQWQLNKKNHLKFSSANTVIDAKHFRGGMGGGGTMVSIPLNSITHKE